MGEAAVLDFSIPVPVPELFRSALKAEEKEGRFYVKLLASTSDIDLHGDITTPQALAASEDDLLKNSTVYFNHKKDKAVGRVVATEYIPDKESLEVIILMDEDEKELQGKIQSGSINKASMGALVLNADRVVDPASGKAVNRILRMLMKEVSLLPGPANTEARTLAWWIAKSEEGSTADKGEVMDPKIETPAVVAPVVAPARPAFDLGLEMKRIEKEEGDRLEAQKAESVNVQKLKFILGKISEVGDESVKALAKEALAVLASGTAMSPQAPAPAVASEKSELGRMSARLDHLGELVEKALTKEKGEEKAPLAPPAPAPLAPEPAPLAPLVVVRKGEGKTEVAPANPTSELASKIEEGKKVGKSGLDVLAEEGQLVQKLG